MMKSTQQKLYESLGFLFYSIAHADNKIAAGETEALSQSVKQQWVPNEESTDVFGTDAAYYISICFDYLVDQDMSTKAAWQSFLHFYQQHIAVFDPKMKERILVTAQQIADSTSVHFLRKTQGAAVERIVYGNALALSFYIIDFWLAS